LRLRALPVTPDRVFDALTARRRELRLKQARSAKAA
jgi:hypothetical protein